MSPGVHFLDQLEAEAIHILREAAVQLQPAAVLFSGGKDSITLVHLARKAFWPGPIPFPLLHIDTGHNFQEALDFRDALAARTGTELIVRRVQDTIDQGKVKEESGPYASRNVLQTVTLLDAIAELGLRAAIGGGRRDEEKARAKERVFSLRTDTGKWNPHDQRPELWHLYNGFLRSGEHARVFPLSNWTELDIWSYILREQIEVPSIYFSHRRRCIRRSDGTLLAWSPYVRPGEGDRVEELDARCRTVGDMTCTGMVESRASDVQEVVRETAATRLAERSSRADDKRSDTAMEDRKREGYF
ncbi:MAG TPA: sulfate adenylyltransferase subunit CysD [Polyangiaceae bacterium]|nr:sulfate adenylyltransferase subunit CysD [Polyangiaceae bacterium]